MPSADVPATPTVPDFDTNSVIPSAVADAPVTVTLAPFKAHGTYTPSESSTIQVADADSQGKPGPTSKNFHPAAMKNGRNLCTHHWLKKVAPNGYSQDFKLYWDSLGKDRQEKYETDAKNWYLMAFGLATPLK
ncbi:hypothetical protein BDR03DRAFT_980510 [Suillus americanus]|nr:hypothetical protein BDR03DRAFT_980510 [Suillus americanus]